MKADILKRLHALEQEANLVNRPPLCLLEAHRLPPDDRAAFWEGDDAVLTRHGLPDCADARDIRAVVISIHPAMRDQWQSTAGMDEGDLEAFEQAAILEDQRREREVRAEKERAAMEAIRNSRPRALIGHDRGGNLVYHDDPRWGD